MLSPDVRVAITTRGRLDAVVARFVSQWPVVRAVLPHYRVGQRTDIAFGIAAWLRTHGSTRDQVVEFLQGLGRVVRDPDGGDNARVVDDTFARPESEVAIACLDDDILAALAGLRGGPAARQLPLPTLTTSIGPEVRRGATSTKCAVPWCRRIPVEDDLCRRHLVHE